ncbi:hypothetical protein [Micromonospora sp. AKA38]|uniref:hypothetical protein n=1 Tax=Micromonospora sp. AKA38 TaxID=2733861 RepID=UPI0022C7A1C3|nr:hypothetical protein [Micromonospora sp. AKA38]GHJ15344.1 hypothetical protein TPA0908_33390 [Micromonospora sp. AKA38]
MLIGRRLSSEEFTAVLTYPTAVDRLLYGDLDDDDAEMPEPELDLDKVVTRHPLPAHWHWLAGQ